MHEPFDQAAVEAAAAAIREDGGRRGSLLLRGELEEAGYSKADLSEAERIVGNERVRAALARERRRQARAPMVRIFRVVGAVAVAMALGCLTVLAARVTVSLIVTPLPVVIAFFGFVMLPAFTGALIAAAGASKRVARVGLVGLILLLPITMLLTWAVAGGDGSAAQSDWRQVLHPGALEPLLIMTAVVLVPSVLGYGTTTYASRSA